MSILRPLRLHRREVALTTFYLVPLQHHQQTSSKRRHHPLRSRRPLWASRLATRLLFLAPIGNFQQASFLFHPGPDTLETFEV
jgi:hypothetical protein